MTFVGEEGLALVSSKLSLWEGLLHRRRAPKPHRKQPRTGLTPSRNRSGSGKTFRKSRKCRMSDTRQKLPKIQRKGENVLPGRCLKKPETKLYPSFKPQVLAYQIPPRGLRMREEDDSHSQRAPHREGYALRFCGSSPPA